MADSTSVPTVPEPFRDLLQTDVAILSTIGPDGSPRDDERRRVAGVQDSAGRGCRVVPGHRDDDPAGEVEQRREPGIDRLEHIPLGVRLLTVSQNFWPSGVLFIV